MDRSEGSIDLTALLAHAGWVRRLARQLISEDGAADDVVQDTWEAAVRRPPDPERPPRPWLAEVARNIIRMRRRGQTRRQLREAEVPEFPPVVESAEGVLARVQVQRLVAELVMALDEPYRSSLLLRFYEEKSASEIGRLQGVPSATVRWRIQESLRRLRARLDEQHGDERGAWLALVMPVSHPARGFGKGAVLMATKSKVGAVVLVALLLAIGGVVWLGARKVVPSNSREAVATAPMIGTGRVIAFAVPPEGSNASLDIAVVGPDGTPIAGTMVTLSRSTTRAADAGLPALAAAGTTDSGGHLALDHLPPGIYTACAGSSAAGLVSTARPGIELRATERTSVRLVLGRGGFVVRGTVSDSGAGVVGGARITATQTPASGSETGPLRFFAVVSDQRGAFSLALPAGVYSLAADANGYPRQSRFLELTADATVDFRLDPGAALSGRVVMRAGRAPVAGATVRAVPVDKRGYRRPGVETDSDGRFALLSVAAGEWRLEARRGPLVGNTQILRVIPAMPFDGIEILVDPAYAISGRVVGPDGQGVPDVVVVAEPSAATGGAGAAAERDGTFHIEGLVPGKYDLGAQARGPEHPRAYGEAVVVDRDVAGLELRMPAPITIDGQVLDIEGRPAARAHLYAIMGLGDHTRDVSRGAVANADEDGHFAFRGLEPGGLSVWAEVEQKGIATWGPEPVEAGETKHLSLRLTEGASLAGTVHYADGAPAAGATVSVLGPDQDRGRVSHGLVATDGHYIVRGIIPGAVKVAAHRRRATRFDAPKHLVLVADKENSLDLMLARAAPIGGRVMLADGRPAVGAVVVASRTAVKPPPTASFRGTVDVDGSFVIDDLDAGVAYHLWADLPGHTATADDVVAGRDRVVLTLR